ncbi:YEATS domain-containing protein 2 [Formica exsecta]|uniref:YEATS domain-containing protein 2 n=1 Tax=Formica exsecta TaxID=72781 RepID=UPI001142EA5D|nr:YEATS domain-containing protein 2 [Formica exsecta]XP_029673221.1 YEATS domain-containing protein 2 [Formica exsecta]
MSAPEESLNDQDPDYVSAISDEQVQQKIYEENARNTTARKITAIVEKEFAREIDSKEKEILQIQERLHKALKSFHLLRYVIITNFYNRKQCQIPQVVETTKQTRIHPAVKSLLGKSPKSVHCTDLAVPSTSTDPRFSCNDESLESYARTTADSALKTEENADKHDAALQGEKRKLPDEESRPRKVPRYIPPKSSMPAKTGPSRGNSHKVRKRIIIGNISKWIPPDWREDASSHKWTIYVRSDKDESANISTFVSKVRFFLHPSYRPNDVVEITSYPFHLSRRGWGEFPVRVQLHFKNALDKPIDIIHHLKLDRTYTGLQTLGSETLVDIWIHTAETRNFEQNNSNESVESSSNNASIKIEPNNDSFEFIYKQSTAKSMETLQMSTFKEIRVKEEIINLEVHEQSNLSLDSIKKLKNVGVKVESNDATINIFNNENKPNLDEICYYIKHDHNYVDGQYFNSNHYTEKEGNITIEHFLESDCVPAINSSVIDDKKEKLDNVQIISHKFNDDIQSSNNCLSLSNAAKNDSQVNTFQGRNSQKNLSSLDANKFLHARNSKNSDTCKTSENIMTKDTPIMGNGFCKSPDRFNSLQKTMSFSNITNSHLKPLQISIPSPNIFASSTNKRMLLLKDTKSIPVDVTNILASKSTENSRKLIDGDVKLSISRDGNIAKLNVRIPQTVSILKKPPNAKMNARHEGTVSDNKKPAVLMLKNTNNLLLNINENVPILKIADSHDPRYNYSLAEASKGISSTDKQEIMPYVRSEDKTVTQRVKITLGKDKYKIQSKRELYEATLRSIDTANIVDTEELIRFIIRRLPIVTRDARDPEYKWMHPYACCSEKEYFAHNVGKQRALEWYRAKTIRCFLRTKMVPSDRLWSIKEIMLWARLHGYTPSRNASGISEAVTMSDTKKLPDTTIPTAVPATYTESIALQKWLQTCQEESSQLRHACIEDEEIDVESVDESSCKITIDRRKNDNNRNSDSSTGSKLIPLELDESLLPFHNFVCDTARDIGIKIGPEEIIPGVLYSAASRVMMRVVECFVEDLTRTSLAKAWERNSGNECPKVIKLNDVHNALTSREEFDIFTNEGLGSMQQSNTKESSSL